VLNEQYLIFSLHGSLYGINAASVREICWLPELYSLATAPADILGMFNWRSHMMPVMHLDLRFGRQFSGCNVTDRTIVVEWQNTYLSIVAHDVYDVESLTIESVDLDLIQGRQIAVDRAFVTGVARLNEHPVICLDLDRLIREPDAIVALRNGDTLDLGTAGMDFHSRCCPESSMAEMEIFASRAAALKISIAETQVIPDEGVLVVQIGGEYLGFPLELVVDVDAIDRFPVSSVPASPNYIIGQINWRGSILPVLEIGRMFQLPIQPRAEFVVVEIDKIKVGIMVDRIFDVSYLANSEIDGMPTGVDKHNQIYLRGMTKYADGLMYLVKLKESIEREFLSVAV
jgi:purine-binding chemotaxis protein CheW